MAWQCLSPELTVKGFKNCCMPSAMDVIGDDMLWNGSEEDGTVWSECEECADIAKAYRIYCALCKKCMKLMVIYFSLADILYWGGDLSFGAWGGVVVKALRY